MTAATGPYTVNYLAGTDYWRVWGPCVDAGHICRRDAEDLCRNLNLAHAAGLAAGRAEAEAEVSLWMQRHHTECAEVARLRELCDAAIDLIEATKAKAQTEGTLSARRRVVVGWHESASLRFHQINAALAEKAAGGKE